MQQVPCNVKLQAVQFSLKKIFWGQIFRTMPTNQVDRQRSFLRLAETMTQDVGLSLTFLLTDVLRIIHFSNQISLKNNYFFRFKEWLFCVSIISSCKFQFVSGHTTTPNNSQIQINSLADRVFMSNLNVYFSCMHVILS